jgi:uncharacterized protein
MKNVESGRNFAVLQQKIASRESILVAYSGGVDSSLLAAVANKVLGEQAHAVFVDSPLVPRSAVTAAVTTAQDLGLSFEIVRVPALVEAVRTNPPDRCYHCKKLVSQILKRMARERGFSCVADGINCSDWNEHRPGIKASSEEGIVHPFIEAGIAKADIRNLAREWGYQFWDKPSAACLSSRIPYGEEITKEKLRMIEEAEAYLHSKGFSQVRVRMHLRVGRIEVEAKDIPGIVAMREEITRKFRLIGIPYTTLDLEGYRSGSMDEVLQSGR